MLASLSRPYLFNSFLPLRLCCNEEVKQTRGDNIQRLPLEACFHAAVNGEISLISMKAHRCDGGQGGGVLFMQHYFWFESWLKDSCNEADPLCRHCSWRTAESTTQELEESERRAGLKSRSCLKHRVHLDCVPTRNWRRTDFFTSGVNGDLSLTFLDDVQLLW